jgi:hypothetical protein
MLPVTRHQDGMVVYHDQPLLCSATSWWKRSPSGWSDQPITPASIHAAHSVVDGAGESWVWL